MGGGEELFAAEQFQLHQPRWEIGLQAMTSETNTILVVDDEAANRRMLKRLLCSRYNVRTATNGVAALQILKDEEVALLISDQKMHGMSGLELIRASRKVHPDLLCMLVTGNTNNDTSIEAINDAGALRVIHKPWNAEMVLQFVEAALAQRETLIECRQANAQIQMALSQLKLVAQELRLFSTPDNSMTGDEL
jgi:DNA-binding NtrC family response regulator